MTSTQPTAIQITDKLTLKLKKDSKWLLSRIYSIYNDSRYPEKEVEPYPDKQSFKEGLKGEWILLAYVNRKLVGFASFYTTHGFLHLINVLPDYQGLGIGQSLIQKVISVCQKENYATHLTLMADVKNVSSHGFYVKQGFERMNDEPIKGKTFLCYKFEKEINTRLDHNVDYDYAIKVTTVAGIKELKAQGVDISTAYFTIIQLFSEDMYIQVSLEPTDEGERLIKTHVGADIAELKIHEANEHTIELPQRTGYLDCFERTPVLSA